jgi:hypothetical protein
MPLDARLRCGEVRNVDLRPFNGFFFLHCRGSGGEVGRRAGSKDLEALFVA